MRAIFVVAGLAAVLGSAAITPPAYAASQYHGTNRSGYYGRATPYRSVPQPAYRGESPCADPGAHVWCPPAPSRNGAAESAGNG
jgi:hypothetical protein